MGNGVVVRRNPNPIGDPSEMLNPCGRGRERIVEVTVRTLCKVLRLCGEREDGMVFINPNPIGDSEPLFAPKKNSFQR